MEFWPNQTLTSTHPKLTQRSHHTQPTTAPQSPHHPNNDDRFSSSSPPILGREQCMVLAKWAWETRRSMPRSRLLGTFRGWPQGWPRPYILFRWQLHLQQNLERYLEKHSNLQKEQRQIFVPRGHEIPHSHWSFSKPRLADDAIMCFGHGSHSFS